MRPSKLNEHQEKHCPVLKANIDIQYESTPSTSIGSKMGGEHKRKAVKDIFKVDDKILASCDDAKILVAKMDRSTMDTWLNGEYACTACNFVANKADKFLQHWRINHLNRFGGNCLIVQDTRYVLQQ